MEVLNQMMVNGKTGRLEATVPMLARAVGCQEQEAHSCINEIKTSRVGDVFDTDGFVVIVNRRMQREHEKRLAVNNRVKKHRGAGQDDLISEVSPQLMAEEFGQFWAAYPRKTAKSIAEQAFKKARTSPAWPGMTKVLGAIRQQSSSLGWSKDREQYIPHPSTWLNQQRWTDVCDGSVLGVRPRPLQGNF